MLKSCNPLSSWATRAVVGAGLWLLVAAALADEPRASVVKTGTVKAATVTKGPAATPATMSAVAAGPAPTVICVNAVQCFSAKASASPTNAQRTLDLRPPDIRHVFSEAELQQKIQDPADEHEIQETVQVEGQRRLAPVSIGLLSIPWAVMHPTQAWRIFTPITD